MWNNQGIIQFDETESGHLQWQVGLELPKNLIPENVKNKEQFKNGWIFSDTRSAGSRESLGISIQEYIRAFRQISKKFEEWANYLEKYHNEKQE